MCVVWFGPVMFAAMGVTARPQVWALVIWSAVAAVGWVWAWVVMLGRQRAAGPGALVDLTPTRPLLLPGALMVGGMVGCLLSF